MRKLSAALAVLARLGAAGAVTNVATMSAVAEPYGNPNCLCLCASCCSPW
jgi:hypothetical protein